MKTLIAISFVIALGNAWPTNPSQCHIADSYPFFKIKPYSEMRDISTQRREEMKNELIFLTELSRFLNKKAPLLLQEFAESRKIFQTKKKLGMMQLEADVRSKLFEENQRNPRSLDQNNDDFINEDEENIREQDTTVRPIDQEITNIAESASEVAGQIVGVLTESAQDVIDLFQTVIDSVGDVLEATLPESTWNYLCVATWWPIQDEHCLQARCSVCTPSVMSAMSVCRSAYNVNLKCVQKVMGEGFCNFCIAEFL